MSTVSKYEQESFLNAKREAWQWKIFGFLGIGIGLLSVIGWMLVIPLKEIRAVPFSIDPETQLPVLLTEKVVELEASEAMAFREIANYVRDRETYDVQDNEERVYSVLRRSDEEAKRTWTDLWNTSNEAHPDNVYSETTKVLTEVRAVTPVSDTTAQVEIVKSLQDRNSPPIEARYIVTVTYGFEEKIVTSMDELLENPFGFTVTNYRIDIVGNL